MRVCLVSKELAGLRGGGIGTYVAEAGRALKAAGHEPWLLTCPPTSEETAEIGGDLRDHAAFSHVLYVGENLEAGNLDLRFSYGGEAYRHSWLVHQTLMHCGQDFDYIEFPDYNAEGYVALQEQHLFRSYGDTVLALCLHSPSHEIYDYNRQLHLLGPRERQVILLEDAAIRCADLLTCPSERLLEMLQSRLQPRDGGRILRYPMQLPAELPAGPAARDRLEDLSFMYFGRIEPRKGVDKLIEAFRRMPDLKIELVGRDGTYSPFGESYVEYLSKDLPANVRISAPLGRERMLARIRECDICILPSTWENWPNTAIEAMAAARVVIGGRNGGMGEMIEHADSGFHVDGNDPDSIVAVIQADLRESLGKLDEIGKRAASRIRQLCDPQLYVRAIEERVESLRGKNPAKPSAQQASALVSVITPYYREDAETLGAAVSSALTQTHRNLELIIFNDGSPREDAAQILAEMEKRDSRVKVINKTNGGLASARNRAIKEAQGEFVLFLDADNILEQDYAATGIEAFANHPGASALSVQCRHFTRTPKDGPGVYNPLPFHPALSLFRNAFGDAGGMFRTAVFRDHGLRFDPKVDLYSDWALWLDCANAGLRVEPVPRCLFHYRVHAESSSAEEAWDHHLALLGLLIERHMPALGQQEERELLTTLTQGWGVGAILSALSKSNLFEEQPVRMAKAVHGSGLTFRVLNTLSKRSARWPVLGKLGRGLARLVLGVHGRSKG
ncbi:MAG: glycosyltransferase [Planctomycetota bacterium]|jgi:glycosyltransferase involved in cell wall biosynthesis/GT2 family glycosyltransferase